MAVPPAAGVTREFSYREVNAFAAVLRLTPVDAEALLPLHSSVDSVKLCLTRGNAPGERCMSSHAKTEAGRLEIEQRTRRLPAALRSILLMVDGHRSDAELRTLAEGLHAPADTLEQLYAMGLIARVGDQPAVAEPAAVPAEAAQEYLRLYDRMSAAVTQHLGLKGYFMQLKIERCENAQALLELLPEMETALRKARGEDFAEHWLESVRSPG